VHNITTASFTGEIAALAQDFSGTIGVCAERLDTGERLEYNADDTFPAASVIKLPVLVEAFWQIGAGTLKLDERIELQAEDKVIGSGILKELTPGLQPTLRDLLLLMMAVSDNTATNMVIDRVSIDNVNRMLAELGVEGIQRTGKSLVDQTHGTDTPTGQGELSPCTPSGMVRLLTLIERREGLEATGCEHLLAILKQVQTDSIIARGLPYEQMKPLEGEPSIRLAYKTGSIRGVRNDVGLVYTPNFTYALALMSKGLQDLRLTADNEGKVMLGKVSGLIYARLMNKELVGHRE